MTQLDTIIDMMYLVDQSKPCAQIYLHKFATIPIVFFKSITSDMHHHKTYMYINFQQNQVCIVQSRLFAKKMQVAQSCNYQ